MLKHIDKYCSKQEALRRQQVARLLGVYEEEWHSGSAIPYPTYAATLVGGPRDAMMIYARCNVNAYIVSTEFGTVVYEFSMVGVFKGASQNGCKASTIIKVA